MDHRRANRFTDRTKGALRPHRREATVGILYYGKSISVCRRVLKCGIFFFKNNIPYLLSYMEHLSDLSH